jgi:hypothetical protein
LSKSSKQLLKILRSTNINEVEKLPNCRKNLNNKENKLVNMIEDIRNYRNSFIAFGIFFSTISPRENSRPAEMYYLYDLIGTFK